MKYIIYLFSAMLLLSATSCNRNWTCTCQFPDGSAAGETTIANSDKGAATEFCKNFELESFNIGATCTLSED